MRERIIVSKKYFLMRLLKVNSILRIPPVRFYCTKSVHTTKMVTTVLLVMATS